MYQLMQFLACTLIIVQALRVNHWFWLQRSLKVTWGHQRSTKGGHQRSKNEKKTCLGTFILHQISFQMVYNTWNNLVFKKIIIFFFSTKSSFLPKSHIPPVEALKIMESGFFLIRILFLANNNISDLKWRAVSAYLIKYKGVNFSTGAINTTKTRKIMILWKNLFGNF